MEKDLVCFQFDGFEVSPSAFTVSRHGQRLDFEPKATRVLIHLLQNRDRAITKDELVDAVWEGAAVTDNAITRVIAQLRKGLGDDPKSPRYIETLPTVGYRFIAPVTEASGSPPARRNWLAYFPIPIALISPLIWFAASSRRRTPRLTTQPPTQITVGSGFDGRPSFAPDGRQFVFCSDRTGRFELFVGTIDANQPARQLTSDGHQCVHPAWSPDGKWIAYHSPAAVGIWVIPASGGKPRRVSEFGSAPTWSPDSRTIAFTSMSPFSLAPFDLGDRGTIWTVALDGSALRQVTAPRVPYGNHGSPTFTRDGKSIIFSSLSRESALLILDLASGEFKPLLRVGVDIPRQIGSFASRLWDPVVHPTNGHIYFSAAGSNGQSTIWAAPLNGGKPVSIYVSESDTPTGLTISPDGRHLLFTRSFSKSRLMTLLPDGTSNTLYEAQAQRVSIPGYSPNGKWLVFGVEVQGRNRDLWVRPAAGGEALPISSEPGAKEWGGAWTSSGEILYSYFSDNMAEYRAFNPDTRASRPIHKRSLVGLHRPYLLPNGRDLICACSTPWNVCLGPVTDPNPRQITTHRNGAWFPIPNRRGDWLAYEVMEGETVQLWTMRPDGSSPQMLLNEGRVWPSGFSDDDRRILYSVMNQGVWDLGWINRQSRERKQLTRRTSFGSFVRTPVWRPASEEIAYESYEVRGNIHQLAL